MLTLRCGFQCSRGRQEVITSSARVDGKNAPVVAHAVDDSLASLGGTGSLKLKIHVRIVDNTHQEQLVPDVIAEE
jgi:hypothetical protein